MAAARSDRERARRQAHERRRALDGQPASPPRPEPAAGLSDTERSRLVATDCVWCGGPIERKITGRIPKFCSPTCRHRAWEQSRAAASGRSAVEVVERRIEVPVAGHRDDWPTTLARLTRELDTTAIYDRDLASVAAAVDDVLRAFARRGWRGTSG